MKLGTNGKLGVSPLVHSGAIAHHMLTNDPERLKRLDRGLPDAFPDDYGRIPNNPITAAVFASILKGGPQARSLQGGWSAADDGRLIYRHFGKKGGHVIIYLDVPGQDLTLDEQWATIERFNMLTTDALIVALAQLCEPSALGKTRCPLMEPVTISSSAIMRYKGMTRWGAERAAFQEKLADEMDAICSIRFDIIDFPAFDPERGSWSPQGISIFGDRILDVAHTVHAPHLTSGKGYGDHYWHVRFGQWGQSWMNSQGKVWLGPIPKSLIGLDHRKNRGPSVLAKKVGVNTLLLWGAARSRPHLERRVDNLLESIGELPYVPDRSAHWAGRMFDRMVDATLMLGEKDLLSLHYDESGECVPPDLDRSKGWVKHWLGSKLHVERPTYLKGR